MKPGKIDKNSMPLHLYNTKMKQYFAKAIKEINKKAFKFYLDNKSLLSNYYINQKIWSTYIWSRAKQIHKELNEFNYGKLTCEYCMKLIQKPHFQNFQLHHINSRYVWENLFSPEEVEIIHKICHKKLHNDLKRKKNKKKEVAIKT